MCMSIKTKFRKYVTLIKQSLIEHKYSLYLGKSLDIVSVSVSMYSFKDSEMTIILHAHSTV